jgi:tetratricopeptide (TPR) repeat protein
VSSEELCFLERSLHPLLASSQTGIAFEIVEANPVRWGAVFRKAELQQVRSQFPQKEIRAAAQAAGIEIRKPKEAEYPFQFDNLLTAVTDLQQGGEWDRAERVLNYMAQNYGNTNWMQTLRANALYWADRIKESIEIVQKMNRTRPTVTRLLIEARCYRKNKQFQKAAELYRHAQMILDGNRDNILKPLTEGVFQTEFAEKSEI